MVAYFHEEVEAEVGALPGVESVALTTDDGLAWSEDLLSPEAKRRRQAVLDEQRARYEAEADDGAPTPEVGARGVSDD